MVLFIIFRIFATTMVLNYIWIAFFVIAFIFAIIGLLMGDTTIFQKLSIQLSIVLRMPSRFHSALPVYLPYG